MKWFTLPFTYGVDDRERLDKKALEVFAWMYECVGKSGTDWDWRHNETSGSYLCFANKEDLVVCRLKFGL
jgi:hypothetical protein